MEYLNVNQPINTGLYPSGLYDWMRILSGAVSYFLELRMQPGTGPSNNHTGGHLYDYTGAEILAGGGGGGAPTDASYVLNVPNSFLPNAQSLNAITQTYAVLGLGSSPATGIVSAISQIYNDTNGNLFIGFGSGTYTGMSGSGDNITLGNASMTSLTTGTGNIAMGKNALRNVTVGNNNTAIGYISGTNIVNGLGNTLLGSGTQAGAFASDCVVIGNNTSAVGNIINSIAIGNTTTVTATNCGNVSNAAGTAGTLKWGINNPAPAVSLDIMNATDGLAVIQIAPTIGAPPNPSTSTSAMMYAQNGSLYMMQGSAVTSKWATQLQDLTNVASVFSGLTSGQALVYNGTLFQNTPVVTLSSGSQNITNTASAGQVLTAINATTSSWQAGASAPSSAFLVFNGGTQTIPTGGGVTQLTYPIVNYNDGILFDTVTSKATATVAGVYSFSVQIRVQNPSGTSLNFNMVHSGYGAFSSQLLNCNPISDSNTNVTGLSLSGIIKMAIGESVFINCSNAGTINTSIISSTWSGSIVN